MEKIILGRTGLKVSIAGLGCGGHSRLGMFTKGIDNACDIIKYAYDNGVNFFDTADVYGDGRSERLMAKLRKERKEKFYIATCSGLLAITSMQFGSFFAGTSKEFIEILNPRVGERFE